jgi:hypothetical protein
MKARITVAVIAVVAVSEYGSAIATERPERASVQPSAGPSRAPDARRKRVPNEVGKNHQAAQDHLQAQGFFNLRKRDCTGRRRLLLFDRNWKVVRQSPRAGSRVSTDRIITLCSVKYSD